MGSEEARAEPDPESQAPEISVQDADADKPWRKKKEKPAKEKKKKSTSINKNMARMARDLLGEPRWSDRFVNMIAKDTAKIALHPLDDSDTPISEREADVYLDAFMRALIREAQDRYAIVGRKELGAVVKDINEMGSRSDSLNPLGDLIARARSDLLAVPTLSLSGKSVIFGVKLVETESGRIVSSSQKKFKRLAPSDETVPTGVSVRAAAQKAAANLMRDLVDVDTVMVQGLRYQTSGIHSGFGRYFMGLLSDAIRREAASGARNINDVSISEFKVEEEVFRGLKLGEGRIEDAAFGSDSKGQNFILKGSYWVFEQTVEVRLVLESANGQSISWRGHVVKSEIPTDMELIPPPAPIEEEDNKPLGPIALYLSSNKGDNPAFDIGEKMILAVRAGRDAHLYCYYLQADGAIFRIFPNRYIEDARLNAGFVQKIPASGMPFAFEILPPSGVEAVKCFALDQPLPRAIRTELGPQDFTPLDLANARELTALFRSQPQLTLSEASLIVTVR